MTVKMETRALTKTFVRRQGDLTVLEDVNIQIEAGEFVSIIGASGCGNTTWDL